MSPEMHEMLFVYVIYILPVVVGFAALAVVADLFERILPHD